VCEYHQNIPDIWVSLVLYWKEGSCGWLPRYKGTATQHGWRQQKGFVKKLLRTWRKAVALRRVFPLSLWEISERRRTKIHIWSLVLYTSMNLYMFNDWSTYTVWKPRFELGNYKLYTNVHVYCFLLSQWWCCIRLTLKCLVTVGEDRPVALSNVSPERFRRSLKTRTNIQ